MQVSRESFLDSFLALLLRNLSTATGAAVSRRLTATV